MAAEAWITVCIHGKYTVKQKKARHMKRINIVKISLLVIVMLSHFSTAQSRQYSRKVDKSTIFYLFKNKGFEHLNTKLDDFFKTYESDYSAEENLYDAYSVFSKPDAEFDKTVEEWIKKTPESYAPYVARAKYYCACAWQSQRNRWLITRNGKLYEEMERFFSIALIDIEEALKKNERMDVCYAMKIEIGMAIGNEKLRDDALNTGLKYHPYAFMLRLQYLQALTPRRGGSYQSMQEYIDGSEKLSENNPKLLELSASVPADKGRAFHYTGKNEHAVKMYTEALKLSNLPVYYVDRGDAYMQLRDYRQALADYEQALSLCPNDPDYLERKKSAMSNIKTLSRMMKMNNSQDLNNANDVDQGDGSLIDERQKAIDHAKKGSVEMRAARYNEAIAEFSEAIRLSPGEYILYYNRAVCYQQINNADAALQDYLHVIEKKPDEVGIYFRISRIYADRNMYEEALNTLNTLISVDPRNGEAFYLRSKIDERKGDNVAALDDMRQSCDLGYQPACRYYKQVK